MLDAVGLAHDGFAAEVAFALFQDMAHDVGNREGIGVEQVFRVSGRKILGHEGKVGLHRRIAGPGGIGRVLGKGRRDDPFGPFGACRHDAGGDRGGATGDVMIHLPTDIADLADRLGAEFCGGASDQDVRIASPKGHDLRIDGWVGVLV